MKLIQIMEQLHAHELLYTYIKVGMILHIKNCTVCKYIYLQGI